MKRKIILLVIVGLILVLIFLTTGFQSYNMSGGKLKGFYMRIRPPHLGLLCEYKELEIGKSFTTYYVYNNNLLPSGEKCLGIEKEISEKNEQYNVHKYCYGIKIAKIVSCIE